MFFYGSKQAGLVENLGGKSMQEGGIIRWFDIANSSIISSQFAM